MKTVLQSHHINTPCGTMLAIASDVALYFLEFIDSGHIERNTARLEKRANATILAGTNAPIEHIKKELAAYFSGQLTTFNTPLCLQGTAFQIQVWTALKNIPFGQTRSYKDIATSISSPKAFRAVAQANATNPLTVIIPCHRVIRTDGNLGGYSGGGINRKTWLLDIEKNHA